MTAEELIKAGTDSRMDCSGFVGSNGRLSVMLKERVSGPLRLIVALPYREYQQKHDTTSSAERHAVEAASCNAEKCSSPNFSESSPIVGGVFECPLRAP